MFVVDDVLLRLAYHNVQSYGHRSNKPLSHGKERGNVLIQRDK